MAVRDSAVRLAFLAIAGLLVILLCYYITSHRRASAVSFRGTCPGLQGPMMFSNKLKIRNNAILCCRLFLLECWLVHIFGAPSQTNMADDQLVHLYSTGTGMI